MHVPNANADLLEIIRKVLGHALGQRRHEHAFSTTFANANLVEQVVNLAANGPHFDLRVDQSSRSDDLLDDHTLRKLKLELCRRRRDEDGARREREELVEHQWPVAERARQAETILDERQLSGSIAVEHTGDLWQADV